MAGNIVEHVYVRAITISHLTTSELEGSLQVRVNSLADECGAPCKSLSCTGTVKDPEDPRRKISQYTAVFG